MRLRTRLILGGFGVATIAAGIWLMTHSPFPSEPAREAIGQRIQDQRMSQNGTVYYFRGEGPRVVLSASAGRQASDFNELVLKLNEAGYKTITVEAPGIDQPLPKYLSLVNFASPLITASQHDMGLDNRQPYVLIGHAYGNRAARMASFMKSQGQEDDIDRPPKGVILLAAGGQVSMEPEAQQSVMNIFNPLRSYNSRMKDVEYAFFADGNEVPDHWTRGWHTQTAMAQGKAIAASKDDESWHCAGGVPMLIVQPMQDRLAPPENAHALKEKCPQEVEIVEIQNAGHALLPEQPDAVAEAVLAFLAEYHPIVK